MRELAEIGGGRVKVVKDPIYSGSDGGLAIGLDAPDSDWERLERKGVGAPLTSSRGIADDLDLGARAHLGQDLIDPP